MSTNDHGSHTSGPNLPFQDRLARGETVNVSDSLVIPGSAAGTLIRVDVSMPDYVAIGLDTSCEEIPEEVLV